MAEDITKQQIKDIYCAVAYSISCDECKDKSDIEQIAIFCRYVNSAGPKEKIIELTPLKDQTRGEDICEAVLECLRAKGINTTHLVSVATNEAPSRTSAQKGFVALQQKSLGRKMLTFHCILHQEVVASQNNNTVKIESQIHSQLLKLKKNNFIPAGVYKAIQPTGSQRSRMYGLPKIHKKDVLYLHLVHDCFGPTSTCKMAHFSP